MRNGSEWTREIAILPQFLAIEHHFVRKGCDWTPEIAILLHSFWRSNIVSCERVAIGRQKSQFYFTVFGDRTSFRAKELRGNPENRNFTAVFGGRTSFRAKGLRRTPTNRNFTSVFGDRTSFRAKRLRRTLCKSQFYLSFWRSNLISCERVAFRAVSLALPRAFKREIEKKEIARGQESKRAREQEGKRATGQERM